MPNDLPILLVHLFDAETGEVKWRPKAGGRWKNAKSVYDACQQADAVMSEPREIEYVERMK